MSTIKMVGARIVAQQTGKWARLDVIKLISLEKHEKLSILICINYYRRR